MWCISVVQKPGGLARHAGIVDTGEAVDVAHHTGILAKRLHHGGRAARLWLSMEQIDCETEQGKEEG